MLSHRFIGQPSSGSSTLAVLAGLASSGRFDHLDAAVAYATMSGVDALVNALGSSIDSPAKRWLVGIDWFRSEPQALDALAALPNSTVAIYDGAEVVLRPGCFPRVPFHPKCWLFRNGTKSGAIVAGSANLSRNGLTGGVEVEFMTDVEDPDPRSASEWSAWQAVEEAAQWFEDEWVHATPLGTIALEYRRLYTPQRMQHAAPTEDDAGTSSRIGDRWTFSPEDLLRLRSSEQLWIQAGTLSRNRGPDVPGNQLMMRAFTRVFFGFPADEVATDTLIGYLSMELAGQRYHDRTLRYSNNSMDVLTIPVPGENGAPASYDEETLLFSRRQHGSRTEFGITVAAGTDAADWRQRSEDVDGLFVMKGGREFGVF